MALSEVRRYRLDDLRRFAAALGAGAGATPVRASALALHLLWFDAVAAPSVGIGTLPDWLHRMESRAIDPLAEGRVMSERAGTAVLDGQNGVPPLILARAGELAIEKSRDAGVGLVRVNHLGASGPAANIAAEMAVGPVVALVLGPGPSWAMGLPSDEGLPAVYDSALAGGKKSGLERLAPWAAALAPEAGWLVAAISVAAFEPLVDFRERVKATLDLPGQSDGRGVFSPRDIETRRQEARDHGVPLTPDTIARFQPWAGRFGVATPDPIA